MDVTRHDARSAGGADVLNDDVPMVFHSFGRDPVAGSPGVGIKEWRHHGQKFAWMRETKFLVDDEPLSPFTRAVMAGDVTSSLTNWGTEGLQFINADYTITLSRLPEGVYIGLASVTHYSHAGSPLGWRPCLTKPGRSAAGWQRRCRTWIHATTVNGGELTGAQVMAPSSFSSIESWSSMPSSRSTSSVCSANIGARFMWAAASSNFTGFATSR